jgi:hypothetical protein
VRRGAGWRKGSSDPHEAMLDRWDEVVQDSMDQPGIERMGPLKACMRELVEFVW